MKSWSVDSSLQKFKLQHHRSYDAASLSEADTRSKIVDYVLIECMGWGEDDIVREERCEETGTYLDYKLSTNLPALIVEAKKSADKLDLPTSSNQRSYTIGGVLSQCKNTIRAMVQARDYAISKGITFCCVSNGEQFIFFRAQNQQGIEWINHKAIIFRDLHDIQNNYDLFCTLLAKASIEEGRNSKALPLIERNDGENTFKTLDVSHIKSIRKIDRNRLFPIIGDVVRRVFQDLSSTDAESEVLEHCYVETPRKGDGRRPFVDIESKPISVTKKDAGDFQSRIVTLMSSTDLGKSDVTLLLGNVGTGKSTFIQRFRKVLAREEIDEGGVWIYINFKQFSDTGEHLDSFVASRIDEVISTEYAALGITDWAFIKQAYHSEYEKLKRGLLAPLFASSPTGFEVEFSTTIRKQSEESGIDHFSRILRTTAQRLKKRVFLVFDNADQLSPETQNKIFLLAEKLAEAIGAFALISMREESYWKNRDSGPLNAFHTTAYHIQPASFRQVLSKRFLYAKKLLSDQSSSPIFSGDVSKEDLLAVFDRLVRTLLGENESYIRFIEATAASDTRRALDTIAAFMVSGHTNIDAILRDSRRARPLGFPIPFHEFLNSVVLRDHGAYQEDACDVLNVFGVSGSSDASNSNRLAVLGRLLAAKNAASPVGTGFVSIDEVVSDCHAVGILPDTTAEILALLNSRRLIETEKAIKETVISSSYVRITGSGEYYVGTLCRLFGYLELVVYGTPIRGARDFDRINKAHQAVGAVIGTTTRDRLERVKRRLALTEVFVDYVAREVEKAKFVQNPSVFSPSCTELPVALRREFGLQKAEVIASAESVFSD